MNYPGYPFTPQRFQVRPGLHMSYLDEGPRDGEVVVMLHGNPSWSYLWRHLVSGLADRYRCIVPDHIGMGLSDKPDDEHYRFTLDRRVEDLGALIEHLKEKRGLPGRGLTLVLHDWGGMIGLAWAARNPDVVARLVILNTGVGGGRPPSETWLRFREVVRAAGGDRDLARAAWAFAHGMTILELNNRFPAGADLDAAWRRGMDSLDPSSGPPGPGRSGDGHEQCRIRSIAALVLSFPAATIDSRRAVMGGPRRCDVNRHTTDGFALSESNPLLRRSPTRRAVLGV